MAHDVDTVRAALAEAWSPASSTKYTPDNPAAGQCGVSSLVVHDHLGGEILKTPWEGIFHFYNRIDGARIDVTDSQFERPITYLDIPSDRDEAFADTNAAQYDALRSRVAVELAAQQKPAA